MTVKVTVKVTDLFLTGIKQKINPSPFWAANRGFDAPTENVVRTYGPERRD